VTSPSEIFAGLVPLKAFAVEAKVTPRTVNNWRKLPNGLPTVSVGQKVYVPVADAREWVLSRITQQNPVKPPRSPRRAA